MISYELEDLHIEVEELISLAMCHVPRMSKIASNLYGKPVSVSIDDRGEIWYKTEDGEYLTFTDITGRPIMYPNNH